MTSNSELFDNVLQYPDVEASERFDALVGLDDIKSRLVAEAAVLLDPTMLQEWSKEHYGSVVKSVAAIQDRAPLIVLAGDVGTGKTELAECVGHVIASTLEVSTVTLYSLSLSSRGHGLVGEMTTLLAQAFEYIGSSVTRARNSNGKLTQAVIFLIDEADAIAQSRELEQMHHEDRAGVTALMKGIDKLRREHLPVLTIMCTNRADAIDPAVMRRAANIFQFDRPTLMQRRNVLTRALSDMDIRDVDIDFAAELLGENSDRSWGATYSDLRQRFIPDLILAAFMNKEKVTGEILIDSAKTFTPTRPFAQNVSS